MGVVVGVYGYLVYTASISEAGGFSDEFLYARVQSFWRTEREQLAHLYLPSRHWLLDNLDGLHSYFEKYR